MRGAALSLVALFLMTAAGAASDTSKSSAASRKIAARQSSVKSSSKHTRKRTARRRHHHRRRGSRARLARLKMRPERAAEIQQALVDRGYLNQKPNGKWDVATRAAMKRFQQDHEFPATGLPEAKSLMKLGLGPHPLPADLDPDIPTRAQVAPPAHPDSSPSDNNTPSE